MCRWSGPADEVQGTGGVAGRCWWSLLIGEQAWRSSDDHGGDSVRQSSKTKVVNGWWWRVLVRHGGVATGHSGGGTQWLVGCAVEGK